jgi:hypothetical protein
VPTIKVSLECNGERNAIVAEYNKADDIEKHLRHCAILLADWWKERLKENGE